MQLSQSPSAARQGYGPWAWLGSRTTTLYGRFIAACGAAGVEVVTADNVHATLVVVDIHSAGNAGTSNVFDDQGSRPRLFLSSSTDELLLAHEHAEEWDDVESTDSPPELIVARLFRMERRQAAVCTALHQVDRDPLTGLMNRKRFQEVAEAAIGGRRDHPAALFFIDIDHFKAINDRHGHNVGDEVLVRLATVLSKTLAAVATPYRVGGEEFGWFTVGLGAPEQLELAQQALDAVRSAQLLPGATVTASIGFAESTDGDTLRAMAANADRALYAAKAGGRDCAVSFTDLALSAGAQDTDVQLLHFQNVARVVTERTTNLLTNFGRGLVQRAQHAADEDKLTKVWNRRYLDRRLGREFALAKAENTPLSLALFDLDHFGVFNKTHGVSTADAVLANFAQLANTFVRSTDWFARYGGEEFVLVVRGPLEGAVAVAERIRCAQATAMSDAISQGKAATTVSVGVAQVSSTALTPADLLQTCSKLLQLAKQLGRNRVVASEEAHAFVQRRP